tara:strand:+ start:1027 stop:2016 length:990 start_codon:yes stop_codon:yes gene_type:complete
MKILVVGGAGYIGSHCVRQLQASGHEPVILDNFSFGHHDTIPEGVTLYEGDMGNQEFVQPILENEGIDIVMHFAALINVGESATNPLKYYDNNVAKTVRLLQAMQAAGVRKFVFSSSCTVFGDAAEMPLHEDLPLQSFSAYGQTKQDIEVLLGYCAKAYGLSYACFRYFNASGAAPDGSIGEDHDPETHLIPLAIQAARGQRDKLIVFGTDYPTPDGTCQRDYVHVNDLSRAHIAAFDKLEQHGTELHYNLGTGTPASVLEVIQLVQEVTGLEVPHEFGPRRDGDVPAAYAYPAKAIAELAWKIEFPDIKSIVETAWKWHESHPDGFEN